MREGGAVPFLVTRVNNHDDVELGVRLSERNFQRKRPPGVGAFAGLIRFHVYSERVDSLTIVERGMDGRAFGAAAAAPNRVSAFGAEPILSFSNRGMNG